MIQFDKTRFSNYILPSKQGRGWGWVLVLLWALGTFPTHAQERYHSVMAGVGWGNVLDTYLSPYSYKGENVRLMRETQRDLQHFFIGNTQVRFQTLLDLDCSFLESLAKNVNEYAGGVRYSASWQYPIQLSGPAFQLHAGPMLSGYAGCVYNERNGNNPAQAKVDLMLDLTATAQYQFRWLNRSMTARYQFAVPFVGLAFSPNYGQSYYEAFALGNYDHNVVAATFANAPSMRHLLTLDVPLSKRPNATTLRIGYSGNFMQAKFNNLRYHSYTHAILIGFTQTFNAL